MLLDLLRFWWKQDFKNSEAVARHIGRNGRDGVAAYCGWHLVDKGRRLRLEESLAEEHVLYKCCKAAGPPNRVATDYEGRKKENLDYLRARAVAITDIKHKLRLMGPEVGA